MEFCERNNWLTFTSTEPFQFYEEIYLTNITLCKQLCDISWRLILGSCFRFFCCICILSWHNVRSLEIHEGIWSKHSWLLQGSFRRIKVYLHCAKANVKAKFFLWFLSLLNVTIKLDCLWTHLEAMSVSLLLQIEQTFTKNGIKGLFRLTVCALESDIGRSLVTFPQLKNQSECNCDPFWIRRFCVGNQQIRWE